MYVFLVETTGSVLIHQPASYGWIGPISTSGGMSLHLNFFIHNYQFLNTDLKTLQYYIHIRHTVRKPSAFYSTVTLAITGLDSFDVG